MSKSENVKFNGKELPNVLGGDSGVPEAFVFNDIEFTDAESIPDNDLIDDDLALGNLGDLGVDDLLEDLEDIEDEEERLEEIAALDEQILEELERKGISKDLLKGANTFTKDMLSSIATALKKHTPTGVLIVPPHVEVDAILEELSHNLPWVQ